MRGPDMAPKILLGQKIFKKDEYNQTLRYGVPKGITRTRPECSPFGPFASRMFKIVYPDDFVEPLGFSSL